MRKKKLFKKIVSSLLALTMVSAMVLTGCGNTAQQTIAETAEESETADRDVQTGDAQESATAASETGTNAAYEGDLEDIIPEETVTLTVFSPGANTSGELVGWFAQLMKEKFNVVLNLVPDPDGSNYTARMESGDLGDLVLWISNTDDYQRAIEKELLLDWNEDDLLADYGPYIASHMQSPLEKNKKISGGTVYGMGHDIGVNATDISGFMYDWSTRWDLYKELGYPEIKTIDDFANVLIDMQKLEPENESGKRTYAVSLFSDWDGAMVMFPKAMVTAYYGYDDFGFGFYDTENQKYIPAIEENSPYIEMLKFYNKLYQAGALDPDSETQGFSNCLEDYQNGVSFFTPFNYLGSAVYNTTDNLNTGRAMLTLIPEEATPINYGQNIYGGDYVWSIGSNTEYPELCMAIINWLATPEGRMTQLYGPKDVCWYYDENGKTHFTDLGKACAADGSTEMTDGYSGMFKDGISNLHVTWQVDARNLDSNGETYNCKNWESMKSNDVTEIEKDWRTHTGSDSADNYLASRKYKLSVGTMYAATPMSDELVVTWNQVSECVKTYSWKAISASSDEEFNTIITDMIQDAKNYGLDECNAYQINEAKLRKAAEDEALAANK